MSFLKRLFGIGGGDGSAVAAAPVREVEHKGFIIRATPFKDAGQFQTCGTVSKDIDGETREHRFIRADRFPSVEGAADHAIFKGRQIIDEQGERVFSQ
ncbi:MAG: HlyU family transcriptional regulator [Rhizobiaceae bacterium]